MDTPSRNSARGAPTWSRLMRNASCPCGESISTYSHGVPRRTRTVADQSLLVGGIQHVAPDPDRERGHLDSGHRRFETAAPAAHVVQIHCLADDEIAVGVEAAHELVAVMVEVALDFEALPEVELVAQRRPVGELPPEPVVEHVVATERHLGDHASDGEPSVGAARPARRRSSRRPASSGRAGSPADRWPPTRSAGRWTGRTLRSARSSAPVAGYVIAHSSTCMPPIEPPTTLCQVVMPEVIGEPSLCSNHVTDRDHREPRPVGPAVDRMRRGRPGRPLATAEHVGAHDEEAVGVDGASGTNDAVPPAGGGVARPHRPDDVAVAGPGVAQQALRCHGRRSTGPRSRRRCRRHAAGRRRRGRAVGPRRCGGTGDARRLSRHPRTTHGVRGAADGCSHVGASSRVTVLVRRAHERKPWLPP